MYVLSKLDVILLFCSQTLTLTRGHSKKTTELVHHLHTAQLLKMATRRVWRIVGAYAKHKLHEQRGAEAGSGSTGRNRRTFNRTDAPDITTVQHCTGCPRSSKEDSSANTSSAQHK